MPIKSVVGHNSSKIWVTDKENSEHIIDLPLVPVGSIVKICDAGNRRCLVCVGLHSNPRVVADAQEIVDNLKSLVSGGEIDSGDIGNLGKLGGSVVCRISVLEHEVSERAPKEDVDLHLRNEKTGVTPAGEI